MIETLIHQTAIVSRNARIGSNVKIGAFTIIGDDVEIGDNTEIRNSVYIADGARIGNNVRLHTGVVIATEPQDLKYNNEKTYAIIGDRTVIREYATVNRATTATGKTNVGSDCLIMSYAHVAHDCQVGNNVIMANTVQLGGHVTVEDWVTLGGVAKIHQFSRIGCHSMIGAGVKIVKDVPPYTLMGREPAKVEGINKVGLRRRGFSNEIIKEIERFYDLLLFSGLNNRDGIARYKEKGAIPPEVRLCIDFIEASKRGTYR